ncbi:MAG: UDP-glucose 4-epimerase GalE [Chloroflexota bacterium]
MSVLVTGGAGYIGSVAVEMLLDAGHSVVVYDNLVKGHRGAVDPRARFVEGDLADLPLLEETLQTNRVNAVMHFAAHSLVGESMENPGKYFDNNVCAGLTLLEAMQRAGTDILVFSSSCATYGMPQGDYLKETDPQNPINPYGESKLIYEQMLRWFGELKGLKYISLRYFNAAGASRKFGEVHDPETHLIPLVLQVALGQRRSVQIFGNDYPTPDGTAIRDYIHVIDLAEAHLLALNWLAEGGESGAFNLGNGSGFSVQEVIDTARRVTGHPIPAEVGPRRAGDPPRLVASSEGGITARLGWKPRYPEIQDIIQTAWDWHLSHQLGYEEDK